MLEFKTSAGNTYAWIDDIGIFIPTNPILSAIIRETCNQNQTSKIDEIEKLKKDFDEKEVEYYYELAKKYKKIRPTLKEKLEYATNRQFNEPILIKSILKNGIAQLILDVTEDCNFRCSYCIFSGNYVHYRSHSKRYMSFDVAKKAIDYYFSLIKAGKRYNPLRQPKITFYGGEPLLNFKLIKECIEYIDETYKCYKISNYLTTNGSLLDIEKAEWLIKHNCHILVSICGPKEEHDRLRVYRNGKGTFEDIMKNIKPIMANYPSNVGSIAIYDFKSDLFKLEEFFNRPEVPALILASPVTELEGCKYFEQFSETDILLFNKQMQRAQNYYVNNFNDREKNTRASLFDIIFGRGFVSTVTGPESLLLNDPLIPYSGSCIPGQKLFVDVDGNLHICERVNRNFSIGNVAEGLNFEKIGKILYNYNQRLDKCSTCNMIKMCERCFATLFEGKDIVYTSKSCINEELNNIRWLANVFTFAETNPKIVENEFGGE